MIRNPVPVDRSGEAWGLVAFLGVILLLIVVGAVVHTLRRRRKKYAYHIDRDDSAGGDGSTAGS